MATGNLPTSPKLSTFPTGNGLRPNKGPRVIPMSLLFATNSLTSIPVDFTITEAVDQADFIQGIYADNSSNPRKLTIICQVTQQTLSWPGGTQGYLPLLASTPSKFTCNSNGNVDVDVQFCTMAMPAQIWQASLGGLGIDHSANQPATLVNLLATANVNGARTYIEVQNQSGNTIMLVRDDGQGNNTTKILLAPGTAGTPNAQGSNWTSFTFKGRLRVYSSSAADQIAMYEE